MGRSIIRGQALDFEAYSPGLSVCEIQERYGLSSVVKLASNENPLGVSPRVLEVLRGHLPGCHRYPQAGSPRLRRALGAYHGIPADRIVAGNGSDEIIDLLIRAVAEPGRDHILAFRPCFGIYGLQSRLCGVEFRQVDLRRDFTPPLQDLLDAVKEDTAIVFLTTPDNPSGFTPPVEDLLSFLDRLPEDCLLVVDEAYMDFAVPQEGYSVMSRAGQAPNLVVLRTFSKLYGLAGLRLGYGIMSAELADCLLRIKLPFSVNILAEEAGITALADDSFRADTIKTVVQGRQMLTKTFGEMGFLVYPSQANFILVKPPVAAPDLFERLLKRGIIVRLLSICGFKDHLRISIGNFEENERLLTAIREVLAS